MGLGVVVSVVASVIVFVFLGEFAGLGLVGLGSIVVALARLGDLVVGFVALGLLGALDCFLLESAEGHLRKAGQGDKYAKEVDEQD